VRNRQARGEDRRDDPLAVNRRRDIFSCNYQSYPITKEADCPRSTPTDNRPQVIQSADCFVDAQGVIYLTDNNAGLYILLFEGA
jgi:hypothetical protein